MAASVTVIRRRKSRQELAQQLADIRHLLKKLSDRIGTEPELQQALMRVEILLGQLTSGSGGML